MDAKLIQSIVKTLAYFDLFRYPLTREELFRFLFASPRISYDVFVRELSSLSSFSQKPWEEKSGYFFLLGRESLIAERQMSQWCGKQKIRIARRAARLARYVPFLEAFFVCNQFPVGVKEESDIDIFIITAPGKIWLVRFFLSTLVTIFGLRQSRVLSLLRRQSQTNHKDNICLSFYVSSESLNLRSIALGHEDIYLQYWCTQLIPLYDPKNLHSLFVKNNEWVSTQLDQGFSVYSLRSELLVQSNFIVRVWRIIFEFCLKGKGGQRLDDYLSVWQKRALQKKGFVPDGVGMILDDNLLKFHEHDRRSLYLQNWHRRYSEILSKLSEL